MIRLQVEFHCASNRRGGHKERGSRLRAANLLAWPADRIRLMPSLPDKAGSHVLGLTMSARTRKLDLFVKKWP